MRSEPACRATPLPTHPLWHTHCHFLEHPYQRMSLCVRHSLATWPHRDVAPQGTSPPTDNATVTTARCLCTTARAPLTYSAPDKDFHSHFKGNPTQRGRGGCFTGNVSRMPGCATPADSMRSPRRQQLAGHASQRDGLHCVTMKNCHFAWSRFARERQLSVMLSATRGHEQVY